MAKKLTESNKRKKKEELYVLKSLLNKLGINDSFSIEEHERPDFILTSKTGERIGVELTTFYDGRKKKNIKHRKSSLYDSLIDILKQNNKYLEICPNEDLFSKEIFKYEIKLRPFFVYDYSQKELDNLLKDFNLWIVNDAPNNEKFSKEKIKDQRTILDLNQIYVSYTPFSNGTLSVVDENHPLHIPINDKNEKLESYKELNPSIEKWWLCIELHQKSSIQACAYQFAEKYENKFDRVFLYDSYSDIVYEIKQL